jgi:hypothetical protein
MAARGTRPTTASSAKTGPAEADATGGGVGCVPEPLVDRDSHALDHPHGKAGGDLQVPPGGRRQSQMAATAMAGSQNARSWT